MKTEKACFTNMIMIYRDDEILVIDRKKEDWPGITFPGGHVEYEESFRDSAVREAEEETGLIIDDLKFCGVKQIQIEKDIRYVVFCYKSSSFHGDLKQSGEGEVFWIKKEKLKNLRLSDNFLEIVHFMDCDEFSELYYKKESNQWKYYMY